MSSGCSSRGSYDIAWESFLTRGETAAFIVGALALVALFFGGYSWFTRRSQNGGDVPAGASRLPRWVPVVGAVGLAAIAVFAYLGTLSPSGNGNSTPASPDGAATPGPIAAAASVLNAAEAPGDASNGAGALGTGTPTVADKVAAVDQHGGGSMEGAIAGLERRLAANGGSDNDWELLAKSYEFLGRSSDAAEARNKHLPAGAGRVHDGAVAADTQARTAVGASATDGNASNQTITVNGEVTVADALRGKVPAGLTLFIVAKSVNSPGPPVAILRTTTDAWPVRFHLDDSQSMLPQRKLSTAGAVTIEARTSKSGQAMPERGDFQGVTTQLDPAAGKPVRIVIERVIG